MLLGDTALLGVTAGEVAGGAVIGLVLVAGAIVQGCIGFGGNLVAVPVVALVEPGLVPGPMLVQAFSLTVIMARGERQHLDRSAVGWALLGRMPGSAAGAVALGAIDDDGIGVLFGVAILVAVALSTSGLEVRRRPGTLFGAGLVSGFTGTTTSVGGPPLALVFQRDDGPVIRSTMSAIFIFGSLMALGALLLADEFDADDLLHGVVLVPASLLGLRMSSRFRPLLDSGYTRPALLAVSGASATVLLLRSLL